jgi:hypothetical protein
MPRLEELSKGIRVRGLAPQGVATVKDVEWQGDACVNVLYLDDRGIPQQAILFRHDEPNLAFETGTRLWSFNGDGNLLRLVSEAYRIQLAWLFDASRTANPFEQKNLLIARLDQLSRNEDVQQRLKAAPEWDLIVCDKAHQRKGRSPASTEEVMMDRTPGGDT